HYLVSAVDGQWSIDGRLCGPAGLDTTKPRTSDLRDDSANLGELIGIVNHIPAEPLPIGNLWRKSPSPTGTPEDSGLTYLLLKDPKPLTSLYVRWATMSDGSRPFVVGRAGVFHCFANSGWRRQKKNSGSIRICIKRIR